MSADTGDTIYGLPISNPLPKSFLVGDAIPMVTFTRRPRCSTCLGELFFHEEERLEDDRWKYSVKCICGTDEVIAPWRLVFAAKRSQWASWGWLGKPAFRAGLQTFQHLQKGEEPAEAGSE